MNRAFQLEPAAKASAINFTQVQGRADGGAVMELYAGERGWP